MMSVENTQIEVCRSSTSGLCSVLVQGENSSRLDSVITPQEDEAVINGWTRRWKQHAVSPAPSSPSKETNRIADLLRHKSPIPNRRRSSLYDENHRSARLGSFAEENDDSPLSQSRQRSAPRAPECDPCIVMGDPSWDKEAKRSSSGKLSNNSSTGNRVVQTWRAAPPSRREAVQRSQSSRQSARKPNLLENNNQANRKRSGRTSNRARKPTQ